jgi:hypothetical protein
MNGMAVGLQFENPLRYHAPADQVAKREHVPAQASPPVNKRFGPGRPDDVLGQIPYEVLDGSAKRIAAPLLSQIDRVGDLRIAKPYSGAAPELDAEVNAAGCLYANDSAEGGETPGEVNVFLPTIQRQALVECNPMLPHRGKANSHIATVSGKCRCDAIIALGSTLENCATFRRGKARTADAVGNHQAGCNDNPAIFHHVVLDCGEVSAIGQEIIIEENNNIRVGRGRGHRVALARQSRFMEHNSYTRGGVDSPLNIGRLRRAYDYAVRRTYLAANFAQRFPQDRSPSDGRNTNCDPAAHVRTPKSRNFWPPHITTNNYQYGKHKRRLDFSMRRSLFAGPAFAWRFTHMFAYIGIGQ